MTTRGLRRHARPTGLTRAALCAAVLGVIVVVVPLVLYALGGLPLAHLGLLSAKERLLSDRSSSPILVSHLLLRGALFLGWISWAWMTLCVAIEARSVLTGRPSARIPASRGVQSAAAFLIGATLAISSMGRPLERPAPSAVRTAHFGLSRQRPLVVGGHPRAMDLAMSLPVIDDPLVEDATVWTSPARTEGAEPVTRESLQPGTPVDKNQDHLVMPRETLWSIAEDRLGSPFRWKQIAELNYDVPQADGRALKPDHWIRSGWSLELPPPFGHLTTSSIVRQGPAAVEPERDLASGREPAAGRTGGPIGPNAPAVPLGGGVVGAGVVGLLDRMRRVQQRHRREGSYIRLPDREQSRFEGRLRLGEGPEIVRDVDSVLRLFAGTWIGLERDAPSVLGLTVHADSIQLTVNRNIDDEHTPTAFRAEPGDRTVSIPRAELPTSDSKDGAGRGAIQPAPLLVTVGQGSGGLVMVNLESLGTLSVNGDAADCEGVIRALALELATSHWSDRFDLNTVGFGAELERFDRVRAVDNAAPLLDQLQSRRLRAEILLDTSNLQSFAQARSVDPSDRWDPVVVVCAPSVTDTDVAELLEVASDPRLGIAVVASGRARGGDHTVSLSGPDRTSSLELLGTVVRPQQVEAADLGEITRLLDTAMSRQSVFLSEEPYVNLPVPMPLPELETTESDPYPAEWPVPSVHGSDGKRTRAGSRLRTSPRDDDDANHEIEVAVLGSIEIRGAARDFTRAWAKELVVYLALHPNGASNDAWATALWPDRLMAPSSLHSTASVARRSLGRSSDGQDHLPRSHGRLALSNTVGTDWDRFVLHADSNDTGRWQGALELVRGRPLDGLRSSDWPILEGIGPAIEAAIVDLSGRLAGWCLSEGDSLTAEWAARKGLLASPYDERLYRMLMRAADLAGNPAGVEAAMSELITLVADDIEPLDSVHPSTMDLYRTLSRRNRIPRR